MKIIKAWGLQCACGCDGIMNMQINETSPTFLAIFKNKKEALKEAKELSSVLETYKILELSIEIKD